MLKNVIFLEYGYFCKSNTIDNDKNHRSKYEYQYCQIQRRRLYQSNGYGTQSNAGTYHFSLVKPKKHYRVPRRVGVAI